MITKEFRPRKFDEIIGHTKQVEFFKRASIDCSYPDVMFFEGGSGSGKTTTAMIIGSVINCEHPIKNSQGYFDPCLECPSCKAILNETFSKDVHFFKSADMEKDDILDLENLASQMPWQGGKKNVIIIDEIQSLGKSSKEATLNLLEKKRKDTIFILCTMDVSKIDKAILSRGQVYKFNPLSSTDVGKALIKTLEVVDPKEEIPIQPSVLVTLSQNSWGSIRQAQQYLQSCIDLKLYTDDDVEENLGFFSEQKGYDIFNSLVERKNNFWDLISTVKAENFYIYAWSILSTVNKTLQTCDKEDWKYKSSSSIKNSVNFKQVCDLFVQMNNLMGTYFKEYIFTYCVGDYMSVNIPVMTRTRERKV